MSQKRTPVLETCHIRFCVDPTHGFREAKTRILDQIFSKI